MYKKSQPMTPQGVDDFIRLSGVDEIVNELQKQITEQEEKGIPFIVSDVFDKEGNQYVDLVQEGGGVWGVALVGYTYVLEQVGIRFFSLAGTSAGAINTMLLAASGVKQEPKSKKIISYLLGLELFKLVDGKPDGNPLLNLTQWVKRIIQKFVLRKNYLKMLALVSIVSIGLFLGLAVWSFISTVTNLNPASGHFPTWLAIGWWGFSFIAVWYLIIRIRAIARTGYGLNKGSFFHQWVKDRLADNGVNNLHDLKQVFSGVPPGLQVRDDEMRNQCTRMAKGMDMAVQKSLYRGARISDKWMMDIAEPDENMEVSVPSNPLLCIVCSDITTQNKIEFPRMWDLYWNSTEEVKPADFVRASMSIPVFFETFGIQVNRNDQTLTNWKKHLNWPETAPIPDQVKMIDGGALSNFPINVFYNPHYPVPRMPTWGIRLSGGKNPKPGGENDTGAGPKAGEKKQDLSIGRYAGSILNTIISNGDKDFINKNQSFLMGIKTVYLDNHSWLNFFMGEAERKAIFLKGARAAADFVLTFNWKEYKEKRQADFESQNALRNNPNNWK